LAVSGSVPGGPGRVSLGTSSGRRRSVAWWSPSWRFELCLAVSGQPDLPGPSAERARFRQVQPVAERSELRSSGLDGFARRSCAVVGAALPDRALSEACACAD
jgi:hypothetical protein